MSTAEITAGPWWTPTDTAELLRLQMVQRAGADLADGYPELADGDLTALFPAPTRRLLLTFGAAVLAAERRNHRDVE